MRLHTRTAGLLVLVSSGILACSSSSSSSSSSTGSTGATIGGSSTGSSGTTGTTGAVDSGPPCAAPTSGPTVHLQNVEADETWTADGSPHQVPFTLAVRSGATLTIQPCVEVQLGDGQDLTVATPVTPNTGTLRAEGTATQPIRFTGLDGGRWGHVLVEAPGQAVLRYVSLENGGGDTTPYSATLIIDGNATPPATHDVLLDHVTIQNSAGYGAVFRDAAALAPGSGQLVITGSGSTVVDQPYPLRVSQQAMLDLPSGSYTGNADDEILIDVSRVSGLQENATLHDLGVPYRIAQGGSSSLRVEGGDNGGSTTLTLEAGVTLRFEPGSGFEVTHFTGTTLSPAAVIAQGTAARPVVFTSAAPSPAPGDWTGLWFGGVPNGANHLDHVRIEYAGGDCLCTLISCSQVTTYNGAMIFTQPPASGFTFTNSAIENCAGNGITRGWQSDQSPSFAASNSFSNVAGCAETLPVPANGSCPQPMPTCP